MQRCQQRKSTFRNIYNCCYNWNFVFIVSSVHCSLEISHASSLTCNLIFIFRCLAISSASSLKKMSMKLFLPFLQLPVSRRMASPKPLFNLRNC
ncbi:hypothetical protein RchiOBHm_Chr4g0413441 [Rosa chinensis]|uniref:Uncharacterized protein n=1 Tax=Rosa chinensis TaxID=74649 RepID=A0A2P6QW53_ROSCH|nr:hypothetical protein RchiOBHm_Chr4g0413441 [Rosa chinensis]